MVCLQVYHNLADRCGIPQLAIRLNTVLAYSLVLDGVC